MANFPNSAVKKIKNDAHREIAAGILIAYGLFPRTNEGIAAAQRLIAGRETWLAPSGLPNYYDDIESDLMTGRETAGIINIRMRLKEFYGLDDNSSAITLPKLNTGKTTVYKPEDKLVDDITENLEKKLEETSDQIMDVVDALIEKQKKDFEDFKRRQEEERKQKQQGENQYPAPIGPDPIQGPVEPPVQGPKEPPKRTVAPENDEDWEGEVPDQLGTKLDELLDQVKNDPLPQPTDTKRRKTRGKKPIKRKMRFDAREMGLGGSLNEILDNVIETREALFNLYKLNKERFEFKKDVDQRLTQLLQAKIRETQIEKDPNESSDAKKKDKKDEKEKEKERKKSILEQGLIGGLAVAVGSMLLPLLLDGFRPLFATKDEDEKKEEQTKQQTEEAEQRAIKEDEKNLEQPEQPVPAEESPELSPVEQPAPPQVMPVQDTSSPGDYDYNPPEQTPPGAIPFRKAAKGGKFTKGKHEKLKPLSKEDAKSPKIEKITKVLPDIIGLPQKAAAVGMLTFANGVISPFAPFIPKEGKDFINNMYRESAEMAGLKGFNLRVIDSDNIFNKLKDIFDEIFGGLSKLLGNGSNNPPPPNDPGGPPSAVGATTAEEELLMKLMIAEAGGEGELGMAAVARAVINRSGLVQSGRMRASQFGAESGSITDIIKAPGQFTPYKQGKLDRELSQEERSRAYSALQVARNEADYRGKLEAEGVPSDVINKMTAVTGFRNYNAGAPLDSSQQVNEVQYKSHSFNTAGNARLEYIPYVGTNGSPNFRPPDRPVLPPPTRRPPQSGTSAGATGVSQSGQTPEINPPDPGSIAAPPPRQPTP